MAVSLIPQNKNRDRLNIDMVVNFRGRRFKRTTGISVPAQYWVDKSQRCAESVDRFPEGGEYNKALKRQKEAAEKAIAFFVGEMDVPTTVQFWDFVDGAMFGEKRSVGGFTAYMSGYIDKRVNLKPNATAKTYRAVQHLIEAYQKSTRRTLMFKDINQDFYDGLRRWLFSQTHGKDNQPYSNNYFGRIIKVVKAVFNDARYNGVHKLEPLRNFKADDYVADTVYLSPDELDAIMAVELTDPTEILARAKFIIGANTGLRISDFNRLNEINVRGKYLSITTKKTGQKIIAPINSRARELIDSVDVFSPLSDQFINRCIKDIARVAGIAEPVEIVKYIAGRRVHNIHEKWELISSHTARRSFATNAYKAGVPTLAIMKITGHTTEKSFLRYIKISKEENAELMSEHPFFK